MAITAPVVATAAGYFAGSIPSADIANRLHAEVSATCARRAAATQGR